MNKLLSILLMLLLALLIAACQPDEVVPDLEEITSEDTTATPPPQATGLPAATPTAAGTTTPELTPTPGAEQPEHQVLWNQELKQALAAAIDREALVDRVFEGRRTPAYHVIPQGYPFFSEPFFDQFGSRDLTFAAQQLRTLGYTSDAPFELDLWYPDLTGDPVLGSVIEVLQEQLEETGLVQVHLQSEPWETFLTQVEDGRMPLFLMPVSALFTDPDGWFSPTAACEQSMISGTFFCSPDMDAFLLQGAMNWNEDVRRQAYGLASALFAEEIPLLPLYWGAEFLAYQVGVTGVELTPALELNYWILNFEETAAPASGSRDTLLVGTTLEHSAFDPLEPLQTHERELLKNTRLPLLYYPANSLELAPLAAADLPVVENEGLTYVYSLKEGLTGEDGQPLTAQDYVDAWEALAAAQDGLPTSAAVYIESVEAVDELTVAYHLHQPYAFFPALSALPELAPARSAGAYRITEHVPGEQLVLEANPNFAGSQPLIPTIVLRYFSTAGELAEALEDGQIDLAWRGLGLDEAFRLQELPALEVQRLDLPTLYSLVFNHRFLAPAE
jgi:peptide/nickel transport system substrate-binding protein